MVRIFFGRNIPAGKNWQKDAFYLIFHHNSDKNPAKLTDVMGAKNTIIQLLLRPKISSHNLAVCNGENLTQESTPLSINYGRN
jgi:hypothetical protein